MLVATARGDEIYRSVNADGVIAFTSQPRPGSHKVVSGAAGVAGTPSASGRARTVHKSSFDEHIRQAATLYQIPEALIRAVIKVESNYDPFAVSPANARGLMQLIPSTAERMMVQDVFDPRQNIFGGVRYLRILANMFNGDLELTVAAYNAGENAVIRHGGIPPFPETQMYVREVVRYYRLYRAGTDT